MFEHFGGRPSRSHRPRTFHNHTAPRGDFTLRGFDNSGQIKLCTVRGVTMSEIGGHLYSRLGFNPKDDVMITPI